MAKIYHKDDVDFKILKDKKIAIIGYGSQGHAHALNLMESGCNVVVGLRENSKNRESVQKNGLEVMTIRDAVKVSDIAMILIPDELHKSVYENDIGPYLKKGQMLMFAHGFSVLYYQINLPDHIDVTMIAPKGPGHLVRREYQNDRGVPALLAVQKDYTGSAKEIALAYAHGIGATRAGVFQTSFEEETETDLFGEQAVLCGGVTSLMKAGYETLVEAGYQPEMAYFECINEMKLIVDLIYEGGMSLMRYSISNTAEYGDYITQEKLITEETKLKMKEILEDIRSGRFAKDWILENRAGQPSFRSIRKKMRELDMEKVGSEIRKMMPWLENELLSKEFENEK